MHSGLGEVDKLWNRGFKIKIISFFYYGNILYIHLSFMTRYALGPES